MKLRVLWIVLAGCLMLSACGTSKGTLESTIDTTQEKTLVAAAEATPEAAPETVAASLETQPEAPKTAVQDAVEATDVTDTPNTEVHATESAAPENPYQGWDAYHNYAYIVNGQLKYWIEFDGELYLHCMFRSGDPEYYEVVYTLYPDWDASTEQELIIRTVQDASGNDFSYQYEKLSFATSSTDAVLMEVKRDESTLAGGADDNILTGYYAFQPR